MPIDVAAAVVANRALSSDYNVLTLSAPAIAAAAAPGQFVMIKTGSQRDPLLRRPFSVFEITRDGGRTPTAITILSKRIGISTRELYDAHAAELAGYLWKLTGDREDATDLMQDTFVAAMRDERALREPEKARAWLFRQLSR